jgi:hypothetical protein
MKSGTCEVCGWGDEPVSALFCVRCGAPLSRSRALGAVAFDNAMGNRLATAFAGSHILKPASTAAASYVPIAWTGFGPHLALISQQAATLVLERLTPDIGQTDGVEKIALDSALPADLARTLVAPPLAGRMGIAIVTETSVRFYPHADIRKDLPAGPIYWESRNAGERVLAVAMSKNADIYFAALNAETGVTVHNLFGDKVAFPALEVARGRGIGLAVQGPAGDETIYAWCDGKIAWRSLAGRSAGTQNVAPSAALIAPPATWQDRLRNPAFRPVAWNGWREATTGVYPLALADGKLGAVDVNPGRPNVLHYGDGGALHVASGAAQGTLVEYPTGLVVIEPTTGRRLAERAEPERNRLPLALSSGNFLSLESAGNETIVTGWIVRHNELLRAFDAVLKAPYNPAAGDTPGAIRFSELAPPIELDRGLAFLVSEGAGPMARLRLWCEYDAFMTGARTP